MFFRLFLLFTIVPLVELYLLIKLGTIMGALPTVGVVIATAIVGAYLVRLQGLFVLLRMREQVNQGKFPGEALIDGFLLLVAGALLVTPGLLTDSLGFLILVPATRHHIKTWLKKKIMEYIMRSR